ISQKQELWQQLFDARQEITALYQHKLEQEQLEQKLKTFEEKSLLIQHYLEAAVLEKEALLQERESSEQDIAALLSHMHEMAQRQDTVQAAAKTPIDARY